MERVQGTGIAGGSVERGGAERKTKECAWRKKRNPRGCDYFSLPIALPPKAPRKDSWKGGGGNRESTNVLS